MTARTTYILFAKFYDAYVGDYAQDIPAYLSLAANCRSPIVEIGCGTGRVLLPLLREGHVVTGVDISDEMLQIARAKLEPYCLGDKCTLLNHNFVDAPLPQKYGLGLVTFYTFNYLPPEQRVAFLAHIAVSLQPSAKIGLHLFYPAALLHSETVGQWVDKGLYQLDGEEIHLRDQRRMLDHVTEERVQLFTFDSGKIEEIRTTRYYVTPSEIAQLLSASGFGTPLIASDPNAGHWTPVHAKVETMRGFFIVAEKKTNER